MGALIVQEILNMSQYSIRISQTIGFDASRGLVTFNIGGVPESMPIHDQQNIEFDAEVDLSRGVANFVPTIECLNELQIRSAQAYMNGLPAIANQIADLLMRRYIDIVRPDRSPSMKSVMSMTCLRPLLLPRALEDRARFPFRISPASRDGQSSREVDSIVKVFFFCPWEDGREIGFDVLNGVIGRW